MESNTDDNVNIEQSTEKKKRFEGLTKFFFSDMKLKQILFKIAPTEKDDFNEETRINYIDQLYRELISMEREFLGVVQCLELGTNIEDIVKEHFNKAKDAFLISRYEPGVIKNIYKMQFSNMSSQLIETVKETCIGYTGNANLYQLIKSSSTINELLHVIHSYIINNENILQAMPAISTRKMGYYSITLYGEENEVSRKIFNEFPSDLDCGWTEVVSMKNKILMMIRDKGHALTIEMDISEVEGIFVKYFVPKLCNEEMIKALPGINLSSITNNGATGAFITSKEEIIQKLFDFIEKVPTDADIPDIPIDRSSAITKETEEIKTDNESDTIFSNQDAKELAMMKGENERRTSRLIEVKNRLKAAIKELNIKITGKNFQQIGGNSNDETTRDE